MSKQMVLALVVGLAVAIGVGLYFSRDRIEVHGHLTALTSGDRAAVEVALEALYVERAAVADRLVVRALMDETHSNHTTLIEALRALGKSDVVPRPPRRRYAEAILADPEETEERKRSEAMFLLGHGDDDTVDRLPSCLPYIEPTPALYAALAAQDDDIDARLLGFAREGSIELAGRAVELLGLGERDAALAATLVDLPQREVLSRAVVLRAVIARGGLTGAALTSARVQRLLAPPERALGVELIVGAMGEGEVPFALLRAAVEDAKLVSASRVQLLAALAKTRGADEAWLLARASDPEVEVALAALEALRPREDAAIARAVAELGERRAALITAFARNIAERPTGRTRLLRALTSLAAHFGAPAAEAWCSSLVALFREGARGDEAAAAHALLLRLKRWLPDGVAQELAGIVVDAKKPARLRALLALEGHATLPSNAALADIARDEKAAGPLRDAALAALLARDAASPELLRALLASERDGLARQAAARLARSGDVAAVIAVIERRPALAAEALPEIARRGGAQARQAVAKALGSKNALLRTAGVKAAAALGDPSLAGTLTDIVADASVDDETRRAAGQAAIAIGDEAALTRLVDGMKPGKLSSEVRLLLVDALVGRGFAPAHRPLLDLLSDSRAWTRGQAAKLMRTLAKKIAKQDVSHGYTPDGDRRDEAIARWRAWWEARK